MVKQQITIGAGGGFCRSKAVCYAQTLKKKGVLDRVFHRPAYSGRFGIAIIEPVHSSIGPNGAWVLFKEGVGRRRFANRREVAGGL